MKVGLWKVVKKQLGYSKRCLKEPLPLRNRPLTSTVVLKNQNPILRKEEPPLEKTAKTKF